MKMMRKLFTVLLAVAMTLALAVTAFAADTGSITITNPQEGKSYTAYKIFDVTYTADKVNYSYTINGGSDTFDIVDAYAKQDGSGLTLTKIGDNNKYNVSIADNFSAASFAKYLKDNVNSLSDGKNFNSDATISGLDLGYYFVAGTSGTVCELVTTNKDVKIHDKDEQPEITKTVDGKNSTTADVGQELNFTITGKVPSTSGYKTYVYKVTDEMSNGLTFNKDSVKVTIGDVDVTADVSITKNDKDFVVEIDMKNYQDKIDAEVVITYTATVNEGAIKTDKETNTANLEYSNDPATGSTTETEEIVVPVYSFNIKIDKFASGNADTKLAGAEFVLKNAEGKYYMYNTSTGKVEWVAEKAQADVATTNAQGAAHFNGLAAGTYYLEEIAAPDGYNQLTSDIEITITDKDTVTIKNGTGAPMTITPAGADLTLTAGVANSTGTMLPETGGTGTIIFVALGALAVICAGVFLVTNKRMSKESF